MQDYEKLGSFYLGRLVDPAAGQPTDSLLLYDAKDLTTHALCVGMTGSGKTGLGIALLEEAAIDGIPALIIDPKGDLGNLMLTFPDLQPADFRPWVDEGEAARKGSTPDEFAARTAQAWREGLQASGQDADRIRRLRAAADFSVYTPGSTAGRPLTILRSFAAPPAAMLENKDAVRDRIMSAVSGLLALLGVEADPVQSREHILLSNILDRAWNAGRNLELADLIRDIQAPPFDKLGVFDLESFYPAKERMALAMRLNNVLASPGFSVWMEGEPLDIQRLLFTPEGKTRLSIVSIAHLSDAERMFFVTLLLNEVVTWMRAQAGTSSLRALLYMDEIFGYFPPSANPPSKPPMLTLLKQARAYGLGCVLCTQNPVDLDYKGLGNTGTWFIGRLQTERDKLRILDGLEGASTSAGQQFDRGRIDTLLSGLGNRVFLMNNVHEDQPVLFQTRWAMSYLRGPLTRTQIETLMRGRAAAAPSAAPAPAAAATPAALSAPAAGGARPIPPSGVRECLIAPRAAPAGSQVLFRPALLAAAKLHFVSATAKIDEWQPLSLLADLPDAGADVLWDQATELADAPDTVAAPPAGSAFAELPASGSQAKNYAAWAKSLTEHLYQNRSLTVWSCPAYKQTSKPGESEGDFRVRVSQAAREARDLEVEKLKAKYAPKLAVLQERLQRGEQKIEKEREQYKSSTMSTVISAGATLLGAFLGRRSMSAGTLGRAATTVRSAGRIGREKSDVARAEDSFETVQQRKKDLEAQFEAEASQLQAAVDPAGLVLEETLVRPRKSDITVAAPGLAWTPWARAADGTATPLS